MKLQALGKSNLRVSSVGLGCVTFGRESDIGQAHTILNFARENGINLLDTAAVYSGGESESIIGHWMAQEKCRQEIVIATKVTGKLTKKWIIESAEGSLRRLQTDHIDVFQLHTWDDVVPLEEIYDGLHQLIVAGKVRYIGCSNYTANQLGTLLSLGESLGFSRIESLQSAYNLVQKNDADLFEICWGRSIGVITYSPLAAGFLTGKYRPIGDLPQGSRFDIAPAHQKIYFNSRGFHTLESLQRIAEESGLSMVGLALAWAFKNAKITSVLVGARTVNHLMQALAAEQLEISDHTLFQLNNI